MNNPQPSAHSPLQLMRRYCRRLKDLLVTLVLWGYFTVGFVALFGPLYVLALFFAKDRQIAYQNLNHFFYKGFFLLCRWIIPRHKWKQDPRLPAIQSSIIVCNHVSYLDSIFLISLYARHTTIAKERLFDLPIFGSVLKHSGYIPSSGGGRYADLLLNSLGAIAANLEKGGNVIIFPEGTRSRDGRVGEFQKGAFKIAKYCKAPIKVLKIINTDKLFPPGKFLFNTCIDNTISLKLVGELTPKYDCETFSVKDLNTQVRALLK